MPASTYLANSPLNEAIVSRHYEIKHQHPAHIQRLWKDHYFHKGKGKSRTVNKTYMMPGETLSMYKIREKIRKKQSVVCTAIVVK